jgi:multicomponent Na+:H+ antiporter subunit D
MTIKLLPLFILLPFLLSVAITLCRGFANNTEKLIPLVGTAALFLLSLVSIKAVFQALVYPVAGFQPPVGSPLIFDSLSVVMLIAINTVTFAVTLYSWNYMDSYSGGWKFFALLMLMLCGLNGTVLSGDLFTMYLFVELTAITAYVLVAFGNRGAELEAALRYLVLGTLASILILLGIWLLFSFTGTVNFAELSRSLQTFGNSWLTRAVLLLFITGFGLKAALVPFHAWLPDAHTSAPAPVSAMLSGLVIKTLGIYALARIIFNVLGMTPHAAAVLMLLAMLSIVIGSLLALRQTDIKRMLAYSSISQVGFIVMGLALATPLGIVGALFHLLNHAFGKSTLFLNAGAVERSTGTRDYALLGGLKEKMPLTANVSLLASMSIAGVPPFAGFWSKLIIIIACVQAGFINLAVFLAAASILTLAYMVNLQKKVFFGTLKEALRDVKEAPLSMSSAMLFLTVVSLSAITLMLPLMSNAVFVNAQRVLALGVDYAQVLVRITGKF